jgi:hypothetical protein
MDERMSGLMERDWKGMAEAVKLRRERGEDWGFNKDKDFEI